MVVTRDAVALHLELAGVPARAFARLIDSIAQVLLLFAVLIPLTFAGGEVDDTAVIIVSVVTVFLVVFVVPAAFEVLWQGRTPGKAALGLAVTTVEGGRVGVRHAAARSMLARVDLYATTGLVAIVVAGASRRGQRRGRARVHRAIVVPDRWPEHPAVGVDLIADKGIAIIGAR